MHAACYILCNQHQNVADGRFGVRVLLATRVKWSLTTGQEVGSLVPDGWGQLLGVSQVLQDVDVWGKERHVLLATSIRHLQQPIQVLQSPAQDVTCPETKNH